MNATFTTSIVKYAFKCYYQKSWKFFTAVIHDTFEPKYKMVYTSDTEVDNWNPAEMHGKVQLIMHTICVNLADVQEIVPIFSATLGECFCPWICSWISCYPMFYTTNPEKNKLYLSCKIRLYFFSHFLYKSQFLI
jgi:hypothetical protein